MTKPIKNTRGTYFHEGMPEPIGFTVKRVEGNLCYANYDNYANDEATPFIWKFSDGLNIFHTWQGKST